jgi:hypothetical protein
MIANAGKSTPTTTRRRGRCRGCRQHRQRRARRSGRRRRRADRRYRVVCIEPAANAGTFEVFDPRASRSAGTRRRGRVQQPDRVHDRGWREDFVAGDAFTITVAAGAEKFKLSAAAAVDGSQVPVAILARTPTPPAATSRRRHLPDRRVQQVRAHLRRRAHRGEHAVGPLAEEHLPPRSWEPN